MRLTHSFLLTGLLFSWLFMMDSKSLYGQRDYLVSWTNDTTYGTFVHDPKEVGFRRFPEFMNGYQTPLFKDLEDSIIIVTIRNTRFYYREKRGVRGMQSNTLYPGYFISFSKDQFIPEREEFRRFELNVMNNNFLQYHYVMKYCGIYCLPTPSNHDDDFWIGKHTSSGFKLKYFYRLTIKKAKQWLEEGEQFTLQMPSKRGYNGVKQLIQEYNQLKFNELKNK